VARRVEKRDLLTVHADGIGADVLCDAARFALRDLRLANRVQQ
jgi:hypothetical protein